MTAFIYQDANLTRSKEATFLHFVEVCGMLTQLDRKKKRVKVDPASAICKALGWYFPLLAKMGVGSVEELLFLKYPDACPYCRQKPHNDGQCKLVKGAEKTVSHAEVLELVERNRSRMPASLDEWRLMFASIYPRSLNAQPGFSSVALFEELGELAEAIRVFDRYPHYFYGEAADVFSYIMGVANEYVLTLEDEETFDLDAEFLSRYPGLCINCGSRTCMCPSVPAATVGRMAKEMRIGTNDRRIIDYDAFSSDGEAVAKRVFDGAGFDARIARRLPFDRGDLNVALTQLSFRLANALDGTNSELAGQLRGQATGIGRAERGTASREDGAMQVMALLQQAWGALDTGVKQQIRNEGGTSGDISHLLEKRILVVTANPERESKPALRIDREIRAIREAFKQSPGSVHIEPLMAATIDDFRRALSSQRFDIVHFAGHADLEGISLLDEVGNEVVMTYHSLGELIGRQKTIQCVLLNACHTMEGISDPFAPVIVGMMDETDDDEAIAFATGFYDAVAAGRSADEAYDEGILSVRTKDLNPHLISRLRRK
ncbi:CHAT domain-containing protein [Sphingomonas sp. OK281]|uniref:CHAT domain-containing protein n=1 Tax=Sphingomonas sp. OK281 TaxID=1881067 RepID=UPI0015879330|nr:CHAT domain-containing protein [Sphingomonas sp. OK281]